MLQLTNLSVGYRRDHLILKNINLTVEIGEVHVLMGLNGSGKSTLLRAMLGLTPVTSGEIRVANRDYTQLSLREKARHMSLLESQSAVVFPMTVKELLEISLRLHSDKSVYGASLEALDLAAYESKNLLELSSGELKRAFIAHALCTKSAVVLLDEPLAHLDWRHQSHLVDSLRIWRRRFDTTFVVAVHELEWIPRLADKVTALGGGRVLAHGGPNIVLQSLEVGEVFAFHARIDENPIDRTPRLTLGQRTHDQK